MKNKLLKGVVLAALASISINAFAEDVWIRAHPSSLSLYVNQAASPGASFEFKMYNPTDERKTFEYTAMVCAQNFENHCIIHHDTKTVDPKTWWSGNFSLSTAVKYKYEGTYDLKARIVATGMEYVEQDRHGSLVVYPK